MIIYGRQTFWYLVKYHPEIFEEVYLTDEINRDEFRQVSQLGATIIRVDEKKAQALARGGAHQGFIAKVLEPSFVTLKSFSESNFIILAVGVTDMGNIGQIIRTAYTLGVDGIVLSGAKNFSLDKAAKPSSGALFDMKVAFMPNPLDALNELKLAGFTFHGADINGTDVKSIQFTGKKVLILGSEHDGIPARVLDRCDEKISIKMENNFDSLNVASAAAILIDRMR